MFVSYINRYSPTDLSSDLKKIDVVFQPEKFESPSKSNFFLKELLIKMLLYNINRYNQADLKTS